MWSGQLTPTKTFCLLTPGFCSLNGKYSVYKNRRNVPEKEILFPSIEIILGLCFSVTGNCLACLSLHHAADHCINMYVCSPNNFWEEKRGLNINYTCRNSFQSRNMPFLDPEQIAGQVYKLVFLSHISAFASMNRKQRKDLHRPYNSILHHIRWKG